VTGLLGRPAVLRLSAGIVADVTMADPLMDAAGRVGCLIADKGYDANRLRKCQCRANFPQKCRSKIPQFDRSAHRGSCGFFGDLPRGRGAGLIAGGVMAALDRRCSGMSSACCLSR